MTSGRGMLKLLGFRAPAAFSTVIIEAEVEVEEAVVEAVVVTEEDMDIRMIIFMEETEVAEEATAITAEVVDIIMNHMENKEVEAEEVATTKVEEIEVTEAVTTKISQLEVLTLRENLIMMNCEEH